MKFFLLTLILLLPCNAITQTSGQSIKDSLRNVIANSEGKEKLDAYMRLTNLYYPEATDKLKRDTLFTLYDQMDDEAKRQGNDAKRASNCGNRLNVLNMAQQYDEIIKLAPVYMEFVEKMQLWNTYYQLYNPLISAYRNKGNDDKALEVAREMYNRAKERQHNSGMGLAFYNMSQIYAQQRRFTEQEESLRECIELIKDSTATLNILPTAYTRLGACLIAQKRFDEAISIVEESEIHIRRYEEASRSRQPNAWLNKFRILLDAYRQSEQFEKAEIYCNKIDSLMNGTYPLYEERAAILSWRKRYNEALEMVDKAIETSNPAGKTQAMGMKMMILLSKGDVEASQQMFRDIVAAIDANHNEKTSAQLDEIRTMYEVDKIKAEKERVRNYLLFSLAGCLLLAVLLGIYIYYSRLILKKNRGLYRQIKEQDRLRKTVETLHEISPQAKSPTEQQPETGGTTQQRQLVARFHQYLIDKQNYTKPEIELEEIITALATNRSYLFEAVKAVTDKTPKDYIHAMRLEEAKLMLETRFDLNIDVIAEECGFNSRSAFYRIFRDNYQINPKEYRKMAREEKN